MNDLFLKLLNMSITAGWLILAVLCIRLLFRRFPRWAVCLLWAAPAVRLICPFSIESPFSLLPSTDTIKISTITEGKAQHYIPSIDSRLTIVKNTINPMLSETFTNHEAEGTSPLQAVTTAASLIWICGMILLIVYGIYSIIRLHRLVAEAVCIKDDIYICDAVKSPFILGIARPKIYLSSALNENEMSYILAHESAHLKRKDHWWKPLGYLLLCIYWFSPLCWAAYVLFCRDIELACDEKTAKNMTFSEKKEYSKVLLSCTSKRSLILVCPLAFGEVGVKERVKSVLNYKKPALWMILASAAVFVILAVCFLTNPAKEYSIRITIPAKSTAAYYYSDEEIHPKGGTLTFYAGEGLGDTQFRLLPIDVDGASPYQDAFMTPEGPVQMDVETDKDAWFKIGVYQENPSDSSKDVYISVSNAVVRIAGSQEAAKDSSQADDPYPAKDSSQTGKNISENGFIQDSEQNTLLYEQPEAGRVCIGVQPSMLREYHTYYYIPAGRDQAWLSAQIKALDLEGDPIDQQLKEHKETGWQIIYNHMQMTGFEDGYLYLTYSDTNNSMTETFLEAPELCSYIQNMLAENIGYQSYDISNIKDIVAAKLDVNSLSTGGKFYSQTITDTKTLQKFENWFRNAEYILGGADCGNQRACLELTLADGDIVKLSMATDSCPNFCINGVAYDYRPVSNWDNREFFKCFHKIPWEPV